MYEKSSRNYPKNKEKLVPSKLDDFKNMLKIRHVRGAKQGTQKSKKKGSRFCEGFSQNQE